MRSAAVLALSGLVLMCSAAPAEAGTRSYGGLDVDADWTQIGGGWSAEGRVTIGNLVFDDASLTEKNGQLTGTMPKWTLRLFDGCELTAGSLSFGVATGSTVKTDIPDAPVVSSQSYLYMDGSTGTDLDCASFLIPLDGPGQNRFYVNPDDPSIFIQAANVLSGSTKAALSIAMRKLSPLSLNEVGIGVSAGGLIPWEGSQRDANGKKPSFNANFTIRGDVAVKVGQVRLAVREGGQAYAFNVAKGSFEQGCSSGRVVYPGVQVGGIQLDLPLGQGTACLKGPTAVSVSTRLGGNAWDGLGLPSLVTDALDAGSVNGTAKVSGSLDVNTGKGSLAIAGTYPIGLWDIKGKLKIGKTVGISGKTDLALGPLDFGDLESSVVIQPGNRYVAKASGKAKLGIDGAKIKADFTMMPGVMAGKATAKIFGRKVKGDFEFDGTRFKGVTLKSKFDIKAASGHIKVKVTSSKVTVKVNGKVLGQKFETKVNSKGCFEVSSVKYCF